MKRKDEPGKDTVESQLYVQVGTQKFGRRTDRDSENNLP